MQNFAELVVSPFFFLHFFFADWNRCTLLAGVEVRRSTTFKNAMPIVDVKNGFSMIKH